MMSEGVRPSSVSRLALNQIPHGVVLRPEDECLTDAGDACQCIEIVDRDVVADLQRRELATGAVEEDECEHRGAALAHREPFLLHLLGQLRESRLHGVVDVDRVDIGIAAQLEADGQTIGAVIPAGRLHVELVLDAVDLLFQWLGDRLFDHGSGGAGVGRRDLHLGGNDIRKLSDWNAGERQQAGKRDDQRNDDREARPVDEDPGDHPVRICPRPACRGPRFPARRP